MMKPASRPAAAGVDALEAETIAKERDVKFKVWLQNKALRDKAFEFLGKLESDRATEEDSLVEVAISLCAIDRSLGSVENKHAKAEHGITKTEKPETDGTSASKKTLKSAWFRWTMEFHTFSMIHLSEADVAGLSGAVQEFLFSEADIVASSGEGGTALEDASRVKNILPSLKYFFPQVPKPGEKARPLTNDQKAQNMIFMREARKLWRKAQEEMNSRLVEYVAKNVKMQTMSKTGTGTGAVSRETAERKSKSRNDESKHGVEGKDNDDDEEEDAYGDGAMTSDMMMMHPDDRMSMMKRLEQVCLAELGLKQLRKWLEEDDESRSNKANEKAMEKLKDAKQAHEQFVKKKDGLRIRLPDNIGPTITPPPMGYGREITGVRAAGKGAGTTVDLMAGMGLKYVHATGRGRKGQQGDFEKSRAQLLKMGHVMKENFDEEDMELYKKEKSDNHVIKEREEVAVKMKEESAKAYDEWLVLKEMRDQSLKCLKLLKKPGADLLEGGESPGRGNIAASALLASFNGNRASTTSLRSQTNTALAAGGKNTYAATTAAQAVAALQSDPVTHKHCIEVGKALKKVDRTLFLDWAKWCEAIFSINVATIMWDYFSPIACDVHCASYSQVRDTFLKLLRPGLDYRQTFVDFVENTVIARKVRNFRDEKDYYRLRDDAKEELDEEIEGLRKEWLSEVALSKKELSKLLRQMGISMKETEMRALIDAFDANGDGVVTLMEFLDFMGPKRDKRGGSSVVMSQKCCWLTTCKVTGMGGGYSVSGVTERALKNEMQAKQQAAAAEEQKRKLQQSKTPKRRSPDGRRDDDGYDADDFEDDAAGDTADEAAAKETKSKAGASSVAGRPIIRQLANGEKRMCVELPERRRREEVLRRLGLLQPLQATSNAIQAAAAADKKKKGRDYHEDEYGDNDFEEEEEDRDDAGYKGRGKDELNKTTSSHNPDACEYSRWTAAERRKGMKYLLEVSKDARQEETLKMLLANGVAPAPPKFWIDHEQIAASSMSRNKRNNSTGGDFDERDDIDEDEENGGQGAESTELSMFWGPAAGDLVSFYSIEFGGAVSSAKIGDVKYAEVFRDPEDADPTRSFDFQFTMRDLQPGVSYRFRIRAFNGFGASEYAYRTFTTATDAPPQARIIKIASDSVTLRWTFTKSFFRRIEELKRLFLLADKDKSGSVSRDELALVLSDTATGSPELKGFLRKVGSSMGLDVSQGYEALFDMIEGDDDGGLNWAEFENFFMSAGWGSVPSAAATQSQAMNRSNISAVATATAKTSLSPGDITYSVEQCESEMDNRYREVMRTSLGYATISRLDPGKSYRFRIRSLNADGVPSPYSPSVLVHTLIETPPVPTAPIKAIGPRKVSIHWRARNYIASTRNKAYVDKMLGEWGGGHPDGDGGVSIEVAFARYDRNKSGDIDAAELQSVLDDLGVETSEERLIEAFDTLDKNGDGVISFDEFSKWWRRDEVTYNLKRSEEIIPLEKPLQNATDSWNSGGARRPRSRGALAAIPEDDTSRQGSRDQRSTAAATVRSSSAPRGGRRPQSSGAAADASGGAFIGGSCSGSKRQVAVPIVVYRGEKHRSEVMGLTPNRLYHFKARYVGSRSNSILSPPLVLMTAPLPPTTPIIIAVTPSMVRLKWYPPEFGAFKFAVHLRQIDGSGAHTSSNRALMNFTATGATAGPTYTNTSAANAATSSSNNNGNSTRRMNTTTLAGSDTGDNGWIAMYSGWENVYTCATLASDTTYQARVFALNCQGTSSDASDVLTFTTKSRAVEKDYQLTPRNANANFTIECTGDICVGDTILITERLFVRNRSTSSSSSTAAAAANIRESQSSKASLKRSAAAGGNKKPQPLGTSMSVTSLNTAAGGASITAARGDFIGERTIAAYVSHDNYRSIRYDMKQAQIEPGNAKKLGLHRKLWLDMVWQRSSNDACKPYDLKTGEVLERVQGHLEQFEVFRIRWQDEDKRKPLREEWNDMVECYVQTDC